MKFFVNLLLSFCVSSAVFAEKASDVFVGQVPIGGMVAIMPSVTGSWQPPASGVIKNGFMRADGSTVPSGQGSPLAGKILPNMTNRYLKGSTTSGNTGGGNTVTLAASNIPSLSGTFTSTVDGDHSHMMTHTHVINASGPHQHNITSYGNGTAASGSGAARGDHPSTLGLSSLTNFDGSHDHTVNAFSGTTSFVGDHLHKTTVTLGNASPTAVNNEPSYLEVVWLIRVK